MGGLLFLCSLVMAGAQTAQTSSAIPPGAARTVPALVKAYLDAAQAHKPEVAETLFDMAAQSPGARSAFRKHLTEEFAQHITSTSVVDPDPKDLADYARYHAHFTRPVLKMLKISYAASPGNSDGTDYYIGSQNGMFYFVTAVREQ